MSENSSQGSFSGKSSSPPLRRSNSELRSREHLTSDEVEKLIKAARSVGRHRQRDGAIILLMYRHGLRVKEAVEMKWSQVDLGNAILHVRRAKRGNPSTHPLRGVELRALRQLGREYPETDYVFCTERGGPMTDSAVRKMVARAGQIAELGMPIHPHMLRHACGFYLASQGQDTRAIQAYLGHKNIQHTVRYTDLAPGRFKDFWTD